MTDHEREDLSKLIRGLSKPLEPRPTATPARVRPLGGIKAVLFDVYGTLLISGTGDIGVHSESRPDEALQEALANSGFLLRRDCQYRRVQERPHRRRVRIGRRLHGRLRRRAQETHQSAV